MPIKKYISILLLIFVISTIFINTYPSNNYCTIAIIFIIFSSFVPFAFFLSDRNTMVDCNISSLSLFLFIYISIISVFIFYLSSIISRGAKETINYTYTQAIHSLPSGLLFYIFSFILFNYISSYILAVHILKETKFPWWNLSTKARLESPGWNYIIQIICDTSSDPILSKNNKSSILDIINIYPIYLLLIVISLLSSIILDYILFPRIPALFTDSSNINKISSLTQNLTAFLAIIAAGISIIFTYQQLQAKVRAESRQSWINEVKISISGIISVISQSAEIYPLSSTEELHRLRSRLELHLNPSELDHRLLMLLVRACTAPQLQLAHDIDLAKEYINAPSTTGKYASDMKNKYILLDILRTYIDINGIARRKILISNNREILISFIYKLSYSLLKREWERVRNTQ